MSRVLPAIDWAHHDDPWYRLGVWCVMYGSILAAPTLTVGLLLGSFAALGWMRLDAETVWLLGIGGVSAGVVVFGLVLIRRSQERHRRLRDLGESYWP